MPDLARLRNSRPTGVTCPGRGARWSGKAAPERAAAWDSRETHLTTVASHVVCLGCGIRWGKSGVPRLVQREGTCPRCAWPVTELAFVTRPGEPALGPVGPVRPLRACQPGTRMPGGSARGGMSRSPDPSIVAR